MTGARHATSLALHRALLALRAEHPALHASTAYDCDAEAVDDVTVVIRRADERNRFLICARLRDAGRVNLRAAQSVNVP